MARSDRMYIPHDEPHGDALWDCPCGGEYEIYSRCNSWWWLRCKECGDQYTHGSMSVASIRFPDVIAKSLVRNADLSNPKDFNKAVRLLKQAGIDIKEVLNEK